MARTLKTMLTNPLSVALRHLQADLGAEGVGMTDGELLARFVGSRDEDALVALVRRHAPMVWGACRRLLDHHDAEDAFQATFLVFVRKAAGVPRRAVANWLYGVARQTAVRVRAMAAKRRRRETQVVNMPEPAVTEVRDTDIQSVVGEELSRLPEHYRGVIILCDLEGMTRKKAARQLGIPEGSVASRLVRARGLLARRLAQRGVVLSGGALTVVLSAGSAASASPPLVASTIKVASLLAAGRVAGGVSVKVAALTEGVVEAMFVSKIKGVLAAVLVLGLVATGTTIFASRFAAGQDDNKPATENPVPPTVKHEKQKDNEIVTAWGREVDGLQAGLGYIAGQKRAYQHYETVTLVIRVRNVSKENVRLQYIKEHFVEELPTVTKTDGTPIKLVLDPFPKGRRKIHELNLAPGKEAELDTFSIALTDELDTSDPPSVSVPCLRGTGKLRVRYGQLAPKTSDYTGSKLDTGELELEVQKGLKVPSRLAIPADKK